MLEYSGGRAGPNEYEWVEAGYNLEDVEQLRQELLKRNDVGQIQKAMQGVGISVERNVLKLVKRYVFDSQGIAFTYPNYAAWRRLATAKGTIGDASYLIHEMAEVKELQQLQQQIGFDFMGKDFDEMNYEKGKQWTSDFEKYYLSAHSKALEAEYEFIAEQISKVTNRRVKISKLQVAAIDPTREDEALMYLLVDGIPMEKHYEFNAWSKRAGQIVSLSKGTQRRLGYYVPKIIMENLIYYVKIIQID